MKPFLLIIISLSFQSVFTQNIDSNDCRFLYNISADSIVKQTIKEFYPNNVESKFNTNEFKTYNYNSTLAINYDSIFQVCIQYMKDQLGEKLFCQNTYLTIGSFNISEDKRNFKLIFFFIYPVLKTEQPQRIYLNTTINNEVTTMTFKYSKNYNGGITIFYPYVPKCTNEETCDIVITRSKAMDLLNQWGLIQEGDKVKLEINGLKWNVTLFKDGWSIRHLSIDMQTGKFENFYQAQRID